MGSENTFGNNDDERGGTKTHLAPFISLTVDKTSAQRQRDKQTKLNYRRRLAAKAVHLGDGIVRGREVAGMCPVVALIPC